MGHSLRRDRTMLRTTLAVAALLLLLLPLGLSCDGYGNPFGPGGRNGRVDDDDSGDWIVGAEDDDPITDDDDAGDDDDMTGDDDDAGDDDDSGDDDSGDDDSGR